MEWVSVKTRLPEICTSYLVWAPTSFPKNSNCVVAEFYDDNNTFYSESSDYPMEDVTHWCHLPQPPKGERVSIPLTLDSSLKLE